MAVSEIGSEAVVTGAQSVALSSYFSVSATGVNPAYLVVNALDRNEYTVAADGSTGSFAGNGAVLALSGQGGDARGAGIVFTWQAATHQYVNATYGSLATLTYTASGSAYDVTNISVFTTNNLVLAQQDAANAYALMQADAAGYVGSVTMATDAGFAGVPPVQATPGGVAAVAESFVGHAWNGDGCWVLASVIAAEAGAGLPVQSTAVGVPGHLNGEWFVLYNGPAGGSGAWQSKVSAGDVVCFGTPGGGGHITTCVSGNGSSAMLVDNITYENAQGQISNSANDGARNDVLIAPPHPASQEWNGVAANAVVIYALDTPAVTAKAANASLTAGGSVLLSGLASAADPAGRAITKYQAYDGNSGDRLVLGGVLENANSAATAVTASSLSLVSLQAGAVAAMDNVEVRAFNGAYWGDWQSLSVTVSVPTPKPPVQGTQTPAQTWLQGQKVGLVLPAGLFTDPQHQALTYSVTGGDGGALPGWLSFNPVTRAFSGTVPAGLAQFSLVVTATDTSGLSSTERFAVTVPAAAPVVAVAVGTQGWNTSGAISFALPAGNFSDPQGQALTYKAALANGGSLPGWLAFNAASETFSGTAPSVAQTLQVKITATDTSNLSASEMVSFSIVKGVAGMVLGDWQAGGLLAAGAGIGAVLPMDAGGFNARLLTVDHPEFGGFVPLHHHL